METVPGWKRKKEIACYICFSILVITSFVLYYFKDPVIISYFPSKNVFENVTHQYSEKSDGKLLGLKEHKDDIRTQSLPATKIILFYNPLHWWRDWMEDKLNSKEAFKNCEVKDCVITDNLNKLRKSDAVFFNMHTLTEVPLKKEGQIWIFSEFEAPDNIQDKMTFLSELNDQINWTLSYRRDSDILVPHGKILRKPEVGDKNLKVKLSKKSKSKMCIGFISHCSTPAKRMSFVKHLRETGIQVDIYGKCGNYKCSGENRHKTSWNITMNHENKCFSVTVPVYKYYLSLENALCRDYVTEKSMHLVLRYYTLPIVRDGANRSLYHPPDSVIDTKRFPSTVHLSMYLSSLNSNMTAYKNYFAWRKYYFTEGILNSWNSGMCDLCNRLHNTEKYRRVYGDIVSWYFNPGGNPACFKPKDRS